MSRVLAFSARGALLMVLSSFVGVVAYAWPFLVDRRGPDEHAADAPYLFTVTLALAVAVVGAELSADGIDARGVAMLGVLAAMGAALQAITPVTGGLDLAFALVVCAGRVFGPGFGFALGVVLLIGSGLVTGGIGPWTPFQMIGLGWVGLGAGLLPSLGRGERALVAAYALVAGLLYGALLNLWFWPYADFLPPPQSYVSDAGALANLRHYGAFWLTTSLGWDLARGAANALVVVVIGGPLLRTLRRAHRRAYFLPT